MKRLEITTSKVHLLLTGTKDLLPCPVQKSICVDKTFENFLGKVMTRASINKLPSGMMVNRTNGHDNYAAVDLSCSIRDFIGTHFKKKMPVYRVRLFLPNKLATSSTTNKATDEETASPKSAVSLQNLSSASSQILATSNAVPAKMEVKARNSRDVTASNGGPDEYKSTNKNPDNFRKILRQGPGKAQRSHDAPRNIGDQTEPLGTAVFTADSHADQEDLTALEKGSMVRKAPDDNSKKAVAIVPDNNHAHFGTIREANANFDVNQNTTKAMPVSPMSAKILKEICPIEFTDRFLRSGKFQAKILASKDPVFKLISEYITNSHVHKELKIDLQAVLEINQPGLLRSSENILGANTIQPKQTMMLWHGTLPQNVASILEEGLVCPENGGQMFGQGVYFADRVSKCAKYCRKMRLWETSKIKDVGYMFLCEVEIGNSYIAEQPDHFCKTVPTSLRLDGSVEIFDSLKCIGKFIPDVNFQRKISGVIWPLGPTVQNTQLEQYSVNYNEFVVYDPKKIKIRYLIKFIF